MLKLFYLELLSPAIAQRTAKSPVLPLSSNQSDGIATMTNDRASPHPHDLVLNVKSQPRSKSTPLDSPHVALSEKVVVAPMVHSALHNSTAGQFTDIMSYGGVNIIELRRACIVLLGNIIARQR